MVRVGKKIDYFPLLSTNCVCVYTYMQEKLMPGKIKKYKV